MSKVGRIALAAVLIGGVIGMAALQQAGDLKIPWWCWVAAGWTGLSFVVGLLIGQWLRSVQMIEDGLARWVDSETPEHVRG